MHSKPMTVARFKKFARAGPNILETKQEWTSSWLQRDINHFGLVGASVKVEDGLVALGGDFIMVGADIENVELERDIMNVQLERDIENLILVEVGR